MTEMLTPSRTESAASSEDFSLEQKRYLEGFFAALNAQGVTFGDLGGAPAAPPAPSKPGFEDLTKEERIKHDLNPLDATEELVFKARFNAKPETEDVFRFKW